MFLVLKGQSSIYKECFRNGLYKFLVIFSIYTFSASFSFANELIVCVRTDNQIIEFLQRTVSAEITKRRRHFDSRIRFYDESGNQVDTCSTDFGSDNSFDCWQSGGSQGSRDEVAMKLTVKSEELQTSLFDFRERFTLKVRGRGHAFGLLFSCGR